MLYLLIEIAITKIFPNSTNYLCSWHVQQNLKKKFAYLNRNVKKQTREITQEKKKLYNEITNLPFCEYIEQFENLSEKIIESDYVSDELKDYLEEKFSKKNLWVKGYMKEKFTCGICTSSRIESKHRVYKKYLNSTTRLACLFRVFKDLEEVEITNFKEEVSKLDVLENQNLENSDLIKQFQSTYSTYVIRKLKNNLMESVNYSVEKKSTNIW